MIQLYGSVGVAIVVPVLIYILFSAANRLSR